MRKIVKLMLPAGATLGIGGVTPVLAGDGGPGNISLVHALQNGVVVFYLSGTRNALPACAATQPGRWAFNATTPTGKVQHANLLTAYALRKVFGVYGTGSCPDQGDTESVSWFNTVD